MQKKKLNNISNNGAGAIPAPEVNNEAISLAAAGGVAKRKRNCNKQRRLIYNEFGTYSH